jgi:hypothetical protein
MTTTLNATTSNGLVVSPDNSGATAIQANGTTQFTADSTGAYGQLKSGTLTASTSGTYIDFTGLPSWIKRISVLFNGVSTNGTANILVQLGTSGGVVSSGYNCTRFTWNGSAASSSNTTNGFEVSNTSSSSDTASGICVLDTLGSNVWVESSNAKANTTRFQLSAGDVTLSGTLTSIRITTSGSDTFDAGSVNILYEG